MEQDSAPRLAASLAPEHDWTAAGGVILPQLRPAGTVGVDGRSLLVAASSGLPGKPLIGPGPAGLALGYVIPGNGFDILVGAEHLLSWGVGPEVVHAAAISNLAAWSSRAPWVDDVSGDRRAISSDSSQGMDAARILLPEVRARLAAELGGIGRVLVGLPDPTGLIATGLAAGDVEFATMFAAYIAIRSDGADEPLDARLFELVDGELVVFDWA